MLAVLPEGGRRVSCAQAYHALEALSSVQWGLRAVCQAPGLLDWLLDTEAVETV